MEYRINLNANIRHMFDCRIVSLRIQKSELEYRINDLVMGDNKSAIQNEIDKIEFTINTLIELRDKLIEEPYLTMEDIPKGYGVILTGSEDQLEKNSEAIMAYFKELRSEGIFATAISDKYMLASYETKQEYIACLRRILDNLESEDENESNSEEARTI